MNTQIIEMISMADFLGHEPRICAVCEHRQARNDDRTAHVCLPLFELDRSSDSNAMQKHEISLESKAPFGKLKHVLIKLTMGEVQTLSEAVKNSRGNGGFQNLLLHCWYHLDEQTGELRLSGLLLERINRYALAYKNSHWRRMLRKIFRRTLGANLDRGLTLR
jgi:hypothetical protein